MDRGLLSKLTTLRLEETSKKYPKLIRSPKYHLQKTELVGMEAPQDAVELTLWTAFIKGEPQSKLLLLAEAESGKTALMMKYRNNRGVIVRRRFTAYGIIRELVKGQLPLLFGKPKRLGTIMIYDFVNTLTFKENTVESTIEFLSALLEEGLSPESAYWIAGDDLKPYIGLKGSLIENLRKRL